MTWQITVDAVSSLGFDTRQQHDHHLWNTKTHSQFFFQSLCIALLQVVLSAVVCFHFLFIFFKGLISKMEKISGDKRNEMQGAIIQTFSR